MNVGTPSGVHRGTRFPFRFRYFIQFLVYIFILAHGPMEVTGLGQFAPGLKRLKTLVSESELGPPGLQ